MTRIQLVIVSFVLFASIETHSVPISVNIGENAALSKENRQSGVYPLNSLPYKFNKYNFHYPTRPYPPQYENSRQGIMDVLYTVANNDKLRCIPRILCELASDTISPGGRQDALSSIPLNVNTESFLRLLSIIDVANISPMAIFAKAAILGYVSKGKTESCLSAYPTCPRDPDDLVHYLNNYNGGFFRYFNGIDAQKKYPLPQSRILNKPAHYSTADDDYQQNGNSLFGESSKTTRTLRFPIDDVENEQFRFRKPKQLPFFVDDGNPGNLIFPDRTGTGNLRLDAEQFLYNKYNSPSGYNVIFPAAS